MAINLPDQDKMADFGCVIDSLKEGAFFTLFYGEKPKRVVLENQGQMSEGYKYREFPYKDFLVFLNNDFLFDESGNFDTKEVHYYWDGLINC